MKNIIALSVFLLVTFQKTEGDTISELRTVNELRTVDNQAFRPGEVLTFRIHYGILDAGEATLEVQQDIRVEPGA